MTTSTSRRDFITNYHATSYDHISPLELDLAGRYVLITGAAWEDGVGFATASAFARAGVAGIALVDLHQPDKSHIDKLQTMAREAGKPTPQVICLKADISNPYSVEDLHIDVVTAFDWRLDILINNAAHQEPYKNILESDPDVDWQTWQVNVHGLINMCRTFIPLLLSTADNIDNPLCTVINVSSSGALSARPGSANYRSSKLAILRWTESLSLDLAPKGLLTYCVNPGAIKTRITINEPEDLRNRLPHKVEVPGDTITWLASERREWLAGRYISCPWDMQELESRREEIVAGDKLKMRMEF